MSITTTVSRITLKPLVVILLLAVVTSSIRSVVAQDNADDVLPHARGHVGDVVGAVAVVLHHLGVGHMLDPVEYLEKHRE